MQRTNFEQESRHLAHAYAFVFSRVGEVEQCSALSTVSSTWLVQFCFVPGTCLDPLQRLKLSSRLSSLQLSWTLVNISPTRLPPFRAANQFNWCAAATAPGFAGIAEHGHPHSS